MQQPQLRGYARIALSVMAPDVPESSLTLVRDPDPDDMTWLATDLLTLIEDDDHAYPEPARIAELFAEVIPPGEEGWVIGLLARNGSPDVVRALKLLSRYHPDASIAKAAGKAAREAGKHQQPAGRSHVQAGAVRH
jgi:hypothetical protein